MAVRSERQRMKTEYERQMKVYKRDDMIQHARFKLTVQEQRCILYAISKIKPEDTALNEYQFELKDFYALCGVEKDTYTELKKILRGLSDKSWWAEIDDKGTESVLRWFNVVHTNKKSGKVTIKFHEDMMPFLIQLAEQAREQGIFYTQYQLKYILPMQSQYSPRLYELLKSYQKNNREWFFETDKLKALLDCKNYKNFNDFKRFALDPAVREINEFTDLDIAYDTEHEGRKVTRVNFFLAEKDDAALTDTNLHISEVLDGQIDIEELMASEPTVREQFMAAHPPKKGAKKNGR